MDELLDVDAARRFIGGTKPISRTTLWRGVKSGRYSKPVNVGENTVRFQRSKLQADIDRLAAERDAA